MFARGPDSLAVKDFPVYAASLPSMADILSIGPPSFKRIASSFPATPRPDSDVERSLRRCARLALNLAGRGLKPSDSFFEFCRGREWTTQNPAK